MDGLETHSLAKASSEDDFMYDLLQFTTGNGGLGFHEDDPLFNILSTPISPSHEDIPHGQLLHPPSLPRTIEEVYQLSPVTPNSFMQGDGEEEEGRPILDMLTPVSSSFAAAVTNACSSARTAGAMPDSSRGLRLLTTTSCLPASTLASGPPSPILLPSCSAVSTVGTTDTISSNHHNYIWTLSTQTPHVAPPYSILSSHQDGAIASLLPMVLQGDSLGDEASGLLEAGPAASLGSLMDQLKQALPTGASDITQLLNSLCSSLQQTLPVSQDGHFPSTVFADGIPNSASARLSALDPTPTSMVMAATGTNAAESMSGLASTAPDLSEALQQLNRASVIATEIEDPSLPPSTVGTPVISDSDDSDWEDVHSSVAQRFTHIDWTDKQRTSRVQPIPTVHTAPATPTAKELQTTEQSGTSAALAEEDIEQTPKKLPSHKRHAGGWPKGRPRKKVKQVLAEKPKLPLTGYAIFLSETRRQVIDEYPEKAMNEINRVLGRIWSTMDNSQKRLYYEKASTDKKRYLNEIRLFLSARMKGLTDETVASMLMQDIDKQYAKVIQNEQDNDILHCELCDKRFVNIANKFNHLESKPHLVILSHTLEKMAAILVTQHLQQTGRLPDRGQNAILIDEDAEPEGVPNEPPAILSLVNREKTCNSQLPPAETAKGTSESADSDVPVKDPICCKNHAYSVTDVYVRDPHPSVAEESYVDLGSITQGPTSSLMKLLNDFGKVVSAIHKHREETKTICNDLQEQQAELQTTAGEQEYMSQGLHEELSDLREENQALQNNLQMLESMFD